MVPSYHSQDLLDYETKEALDAIERLSAILGGIQHKARLHLGLDDLSLEQCISAQRKLLLKSD